jgi:hypothetical protein
MKEDRSVFCFENPGFINPGFCFLKQRKNAKCKYQNAK